MPFVAILLSEPLVGIFLVVMAILYIRILGNPADYE